MKYSNTAEIELECQSELNLKSVSESKRNKAYSRNLLSIPFNYDKATDETLVKIYVANNDEQAFNQIIKRYNEVIGGFARKLIKNPEDTEEIRQDVFLILVSKLHTFKGNSKFSTWLYRVTLNTCYKHINHSNKKKYNESSLDDFITNSSAFTQDNNTPEDITISRERLNVITEAVQRLSKENIQVFSLKDIKGCSNSEIGDITGMSISAVKSRVLRTRLALKKQLSDYFNIRTA